ncbi:hypothetical protein GCM10022399_19960 [Terrabacter ginsenosidimutans]|uniref:Uncharacterized protein n=1 Tax=Terrabacter ginsenosidimutans TaxID=490575 RepID=A0ABP7DBU8_9MICO
MDNTVLLEGVQEISDAMPLYERYLELTALDALPPASGVHRDLPQFYAPAIAPLTVTFTPA